MKGEDNVQKNYLRFVNLRPIDGKLPRDACFCKCIFPEVEVYYAWWSIYELNLSCSKEESSETKTATTWNHGVELERRAIDGDISTYWESAEMQSVSEAYTTAYLLNLGSAQSISGIAINTGSQMWNYLDTYEVYAWTDGQEALLVAKGSA